MVIYFKLIDFIIKLVFQMNCQSPTNNNQISQPTLPQILRMSRRRHQSIGEARVPIHLPHQIVVNAKDYLNPHSTIHKEKQVEGIRAQIDICLKAVKKAYRHQKGQVSNHQKQININHPIFAKDAIHRIDGRLIIKFIDTIYQDYRIINQIDSSTNQSDIYHTATKNPQERFQSAQRGTSKKKVFINLTLSSKKLKREVSPIKQISKTYHNSEQRYLSSTPIKYQPIESIKINPMLSQKVSQRQKQVKYCINCQHQLTIDQITKHQENQCKNLNSLYKLPFSQLRVIIYNKIERIRSQIKQKVNVLKQIHEKDDLRENSIERDVKSAQCSQNIVKLQSEKKAMTQIPYNPTKLKQEISNVYSQSLQLTKKLIYFIKIYSKLNIWLYKLPIKQSQRLIKNTLMNYEQNLESPQKDQQNWINIRAISEFKQ